MPKRIGKKLVVFELKELPALTGISYWSLIRLLEKGHIKGRKFGNKWRVTEESLRQWFNGKDHKPQLKPLRTKRTPFKNG